MSTRDLSNNLLLFRQCLEDNITPQICLSDFISGCLIGLSANISNKIIHVYQVDYSYCQPKLRFTEVPDQHITKEIWSIDAVKLKKFMTIKVHDSIDVKIYYYDYKFNCDTSTTYYDWNYTIINKI